mmetsp:Transcript_103584/g.221551  ORF Transcript_103584/g.221551 Transcript_103584/m.221551 type:complete len:215 (-) Transcript_103584:254-898(-)
MAPLLSRSTILKTLYQFLPAWCQRSAASLIASVAPVKTASSGSGQVSSSRRYMGNHHSLSVTSPEPFLSTWCQRARRSSRSKHDGADIPTPRAARWRDSSSSGKVKRPFPLESKTLKNLAHRLGSVIFVIKMPCAFQKATWIWSSARATLRSSSCVRSGACTASSSASSGCLSGVCMLLCIVKSLLWWRMKAVNSRRLTFPLLSLSTTRQMPRT